MERVVRVRWVVATEVVWQCVDCDSRWPASDDETALLLGSAMTTIH